MGLDEDTLKRRWRVLLRALDRAEVLRETRDRTIGGTYRVALTEESDSTPIAALPAVAPVPESQHDAGRSFERQYVIADGRLMTRLRPNIHST